MEDDIISCISVFKGCILFSLSRQANLSLSLAELSPSLFVSLLVSNFPIQFQIRPIVIVMVDTVGFSNSTITLDVVVATDFTFP